MSVIHINIGSYREDTSLEWIRNEFGMDINIISEPSLPNLDELYSLSSKGDHIVISIFDLYNEIAYIDSNIRTLAIADSNKMELLEASNTNKTVIPLSLLRTIVSQYKDISALCLKYIGSTNVTILVNGVVLDNINSVDDSYIFKYDICKPYLQSEWFVDIFDNDLILTELSTTLFGNIDLDIQPICNTNRNLIPLPVHSNNNNSRVLVCVQDIEDDVVSIMDDIISKYDSSTCIYIYDIGSIDNTYGKLLESEWLPKLLVGSMDRCNIIDISKRLSKILNCDMSNTYTFTTSAIASQTIESFATVITENYKYEGDILLHSLRSFHSQPVYVHCDIATQEFLESMGYCDIEYIIIGKHGKFDNIHKHGEFHKPDFIGEKMSSMQSALKHHSNTMFLDADIIILKEIIIESTSEVVFSNHYHNDDDFTIEKYSGSFNAGYLFTSNLDFPMAWEDIYLNNSKFYEQEGMYKLITMFDIDVFDNTHNVGMWRGVIPNTDVDPVSMHVHIDPNIPFYNANRKLVNDRYSEMLFGVLRNDDKYNILPRIDNIPQYEYNDASVILCSWGYSDTKKDTLRKVLLKHQDQRDVDFDVIFVELLFDGDTSILNGIEFNGKHIIVNGTDDNRKLFQKENLWNIGAKNANSKYLIFLDSDIWSEDYHWFYKIRHGICTTNTVVQGFSWVEDSGEYPWIQQGFIATYLLEHESNLITMNPGMVYGMSKEYFNTINGFNTASIFCDGDSIFLHEVFLDQYNYTRLPIPKVYTSVIRDVKPAIPYAIDVSLIHEHHGKMSERSYNTQLKILKGINNWTKLTTIDKNGLSAWKHANPLMNYISDINDSMTNIEVKKMIRTINNAR